MRRSLICLATLAVAMMSAPAARATTAFIAPVRDNTLYEILDGSLSNGAGEHVFSGSSGGGATHRALMAFDIAGSIPAGSTIDAVTLTLHMSRSSSTASQTIELHRVLADWGEGTSNAPGNEGSGTAATTGDATWVHTFFNTLLWATAGGDLDPAVSASLAVGDTAFYAWSSAGMVADVQAWLDTPSSDYGWALRGNEIADGTTKRFDSRTHPVDSVRPVLAVSFTPPVPAAPPGTAAALLIVLTGSGVVLLRRRALRTT